MEKLHDCTNMTCVTNLPNISTYLILMFPPCTSASHYANFTLKSFTPTFAYSATFFIWQLACPAESAVYWRINVGKYVHWLSSFFSNAHNWFASMQSSMMQLVSREYFVKFAAYTLFPCYLYFIHSTLLLKSLMQFGDSTDRHQTFI